LAKVVATLRNIGFTKPEYEMAGILDFSTASGKRPVSVESTVFVPPLMSFIIGNNGSITKELIENFDKRKTLQKTNLDLVAAM
jgi:hypothetical protein